MLCVSKSSLGTRRTPLQTRRASINLARLYQGCSQEASKSLAVIVGACHYGRLVESRSSTGDTKDDS